MRIISLVSICLVASAFAADAEANQVIYQVHNQSPKTIFVAQGGRDVAIIPPSETQELSPFPEGEIAISKVKTMSPTLPGICSFTPPNDPFLHLKVIVLYMKPDDANPTCIKAWEVRP